MTYKYNYTYLITDNRNKMYYIGVRSCNCIISKDVYMGSSKYLTQEINSRPEDFNKIILGNFDTRYDAALDEIILHKLCDVVKDATFYNKAAATSTGFNRTGNVVSQETKQKMSLAKKGHKVSLNTKLKISVTRLSKTYNYTHTTETKTKIGKGRKGKIHTTESRAKMSRTHKQRSTETQNKMTESMQNRSAETRLSISQSQSGNTHSRFTGYYKTPWGLYTKAADCLFVCEKTLSKWCKKSDNLVHINSLNTSSYLSSIQSIITIGKTTYRDLGFGFRIAERGM